MRIEQLSFILEIHRHNSMKVAAEHLFITPQALSSTVKSLEEELNIQIFHRSNKGISLTTEGRKFIEFADTTIKNYHHFLDEITQAKQLPNTLTGELTLYVAPVFFESILPFYISKFKQQFPNISIALVQRNTLSIVNTLLPKLTPTTIGGVILPHDGKQLLNSYLPTDPNNYYYKILNRNYYYACVPIDSPLASQKSVAIRKLLEYPLVDYCAGDLGTSPLIPLLKHYKPDLSISMTISSFAQWTRAIRNHIGIGIMNAIFDSQDFVDHKYLNDLALIKINEPLITFNCFVHSKTPSQTVQAFLQQFPDYTPKKNDPIIQLDSLKL